MTERYMENVDVGFIPNEIRIYSDNHGFRYIFCIFSEFQCNFTQIKDDANMYFSILNNTTNV